MDANTIENNNIALGKPPGESPAILEHPNAVVSRMANSPPFAPQKEFQSPKDDFKVTVVTGDGTFTQSYQVSASVLVNYSTYFREHISQTPGNLVCTLRWIEPTIFFSILRWMNHREPRSCLANSTVIRLNELYYSGFLLGIPVLQQQIIEELVDKVGDMHDGKRYSKVKKEVWGLLRTVYRHSLVQEDRRDRANLRRIMKGLLSGLSVGEMARAVKKETEEGEYSVMRQDAMSVVEGAKLLFSPFKKRKLGEIRGIKRRSGSGGADSESEIEVWE
ncbi:hypothetical protein ABW19_dt0205289 [Dactylella cylindrospora]|nr:hypothetical protein ABW19_dt0205289 [Dactylella cylindrospora]